ncbi:MAG: two-component system, OmpR family, sensor histidine kinase KdpD, partial [Thermoleophilaceae bacterium]|nr:two-component system, OmpR family, sensor histidine kinase KdpD [Thermoleophilaceae bacterium]
VSAQRSGHDALIQVDDDGPGIAPEMRERVFDRFVRGDGDRSGTTGSGLGLAIVRAVAEGHGGRVELGSSDSGGARVVARMPLAPVADGAVRPQRPQAAPSAGA